MKEKIKVVKCVAVWLIGMFSITFIGFMAGQGINTYINKTIED